MSKTYDLEDRTKQFAKDCRVLVRLSPKDVGNIEDGKQLVRSSGSVAANYIEAKEAKESKLWLELLMILDPNQEKERTRLMQESTELLKIFSSIIAKSE